jgi:hypothetical protein
MLSASLAFVHGEVDNYCEIEGVCVRSLVQPGCCIQFHYIMLSKSLLMKSLHFMGKNVLSRELMFLFEVYVFPFQY